MDSRTHESHTAQDHPMSPVDIIRKKRDGEHLSQADLDAFITGVTTGTWSDYQTSALLMAIYIHGMEEEETAALTRAMVNSGQKLDLSDLPGPKVDKHSTGGVGDKTSLIIAPLVASCGVFVPMMSGRGLGHTGGTLDKLESIPGFRVQLSLDEFKTTLREVGAALIGATREIAPADRILYSLRDVTATVESVPLITASILSKKLAEGIGGLVLDVKCGRGAFMKDLVSARKLAQSLIANGKANGVRTEALLTDMNGPLGRAVGNVLEVKECIAVLRNEKADRDLTNLSLTLAERMVALAGLDKPRQRVEEALNSGAALEKLKQIVTRQGGNPRVVDDPGLLPFTKQRYMLKAERAAFLLRMDALAVGEASMRLGAGRARAEDAIDHRVGIVLQVRPGRPIREGQDLAEIHYTDESRLGPALETLKTAFDWSDADNPTLPYRPIILETLT